MKRANKGQYESVPPSRIYSQVEEEFIISFEHINVNGINTKCNMVEFENALGTFKDMEAGFFSVN